MIRTTLLTIAALSIGSAVATAETVGIDANSDGMVTADEYNSYYDNNFAKEPDPAFVMYDTNGDGMISPEEYRAGSWAQFDADGDGQWNAEEWKLFDDSRPSAGKVKQ